MPGLVPGIHVLLSMGKLERYPFRCDHILSFVPGLGPGIHEQPQPDCQVARGWPGQARPRRHLAG